MSARTRAVLGQSLDVAPGATERSSAFLLAIEKEAAQQKSMQAVVDHVMVPILEDPAKCNISPRQVDILFRNLASVAELHLHFQQELWSLHKAWTVNTCIGDSYSRFVPRFGTECASYARQHDQALGVLDALQDSQRQGLQKLLKAGVAFDTVQQLAEELSRPLNYLNRTRQDLVTLQRLTPKNHPDQAKLASALQQLTAASRGVGYSLSKGEQLRFRTYFAEETHPSQQLPEQQSLAMKGIVARHDGRQTTMFMAYLTTGDVDPHLLFFSPEPFIAPKTAQGLPRFKLQMAVVLDKTAKVAWLPNNILGSVFPFRITSQGSVLELSAPTQGEKDCWLFLLKAFFREEPFPPAIKYKEPKCVVCQCGFHFVRRFNCYRCGHAVCAGDSVLAGSGSASRTCRPCSQVPLPIIRAPSLSTAATRSSFDQSQPLPPTPDDTPPPPRPPIHRQDTVKAPSAGMASDYRTAADATNERWRTLAEDAELHSKMLQEQCQSERSTVQRLRVEIVRLQQLTVKQQQDLEATTQEYLSELEVQGVQKQQLDMLEQLQQQAVVLKAKAAKCDELQHQLDARKEAEDARWQADMLVIKDTMKKEKSKHKGKLLKAQQAAKTREQELLAEIEELKKQVALQSIEQEQSDSDDTLAPSGVWNAVAAAAGTGGLGVTGDQQQLVMQGYVTKKGGGMVKRWQRRYCKLTPTVLSYWKGANPRELKLKGTIHLTDILEPRVLPAEDARCDGHSYVFCVILKNKPASNRMYLFAADTQDNLNDWVKALRVTAADASAGRPSQQLNRLGSGMGKGKPGFK